MGKCLKNLLKTALYKHYKIVKILNVQNCDPWTNTGAPNGRGGGKSSIERHKRKLFINLLHKNFFVIICEITMQRFYDSKILNC